MNHKSMFTLLVIAGFMTLVLFSCNKSDDSSSKEVRYPQLIGTWEGTTSQNQSIRIGIISVDTNLYVSTYKYKVLKFKADTLYQTMVYDMESPTMVSYLENTTFIFRPYGGYSYYDYLKGTFDVTAMKLTGRFNTSFGESSDSVVGSFTALKVK